jgi:hypothetical protein
MRPILATVLGCLSLGFSGAARADDLAEALNFAANIMGDEIVVGYEDFMDWDETEALPILLAKRVVPGEPPEYYGDSAGFEPKSDFFQTLGATRLDFATLRPFIEEASAQTGLPIELIDAVIRTESGYRVEAVSRVGARGLMQLMPETAASVGVSDPFDPRQNILGGSRYLRKMYDEFGSLELAVAAYNAGPGAVKKHAGIPPFAETRTYVSTVIKRYRSKLQ